MILLLQIESDTESLAQATAGLNLGPLQEPSAVPFTFSTIGWPILGAVVLILMVIVAILTIRKYRHNRYRREALAELQQVVRGELDFVHSMVLVKRTAIHAFGRDEVGKLTGTDWLKFLDEHARQVQFLSMQSEVEGLMYKSETPNNTVRDKILTNVKNWINNHVAR
jgi:hypothetical protein